MRLRKLSKLVLFNGLVRRALAIALLFLTVACLNASAQTLTVVSWNVESGGSNDQTIRQRIGSFNGVDLWGLSEVASPTSASTFETGAEEGEDANFDKLVGASGGGDRLAIIFNAERSWLVRSQELTHINQGNHRAPQLAELQEITSNHNFIFMINHLARGHAALRRQQATQLNEWVRQQTLPVIAVGDYNFDWEVNGGVQNHNLGFDNMTTAGAWTWVRPAALVKTQCSPNFNSVLDFVFVNGPAQSWASTSQILVEPNDCDPSPQTSDHRPVVGTFTIGGSPRPTRDQLLWKIEEIERQLNHLKEIIRQLPGERIQWAILGRHL